MTDEAPAAGVEQANQKPGERLNLIFEIGRASLAKLDMGELLDTAVKAIHRHFQYYDVSLFLVDPETHECVLVAHAGDFTGSEVKGYRQKIGVGIVGWVAEQAKTALVNDVRTDPRHIVAFPGEKELLSELALPIRLHGRTVGVINVEKKEANAFDETDVVALETLADQLSQAVANAQLYEQTRLLLDLNRSIIDSMPSALCVLDNHLHILFSNSNFCGMFGLDEQRVRAGDIRELLPAEILRNAGIETAVRAVLNDEAQKLFQDIPFRIGQSERLLNISVTAAQMPDGRGALLMFDDVTEWRLAAALAEERRAFLDLIMSHAPVAVLSFGLDAKFNFWGSGATHLFGYAEEEMVGKALTRELLVEGPDFGPLLETCRITGAAEGEIVVRCKDGHPMPALFVLGKLIDRQGRHTGYTAVVLDITERRRAAEELLREKQKLEHIVGVLGAGLALIDKDRRVIWANRTIREWFGHTKDVAGMFCHEVYCHRGTQCMTCPADQCFSTGRNSEVEVTLPRADGALRQYHHAVTPVLGPNGQVDHVLKLTLDVTDQTKKVYQLSRLRQLGEIMQGVLDLDRLLHFVLTCVTAGQALGFNRAILLLIDRDRGVMEGRMGVGPTSGEEAGRIWSQISREAPTLDDLLARYDQEQKAAPSSMDNLARTLVVPMDDKSNILVKCAEERRPFIVANAWHDPRVDDRLRRLLGANQFVLAPLIARNAPVGVLYADNLFSGQPINEDLLELLSMFANQVGIAIDNAENYKQIREEKAHLEAAYRDLAEEQDKLVRSERLVAIGRMATHVAHEIRNPLVTIGGFANNIVQQQDAPRETIVRYSEIIASEVRRLENILSRVMDFTRPPKPLLREKTLTPIIQETIEQFQDRMQKQNVQLVADMPADGPAVRIDPDQIKQVVFNLCQNALDVMRDGGRLTIRVMPKDNVVNVLIANTGEPIRPEELPKLFEPFYTTKPGGTGLGLALSQKIIQDHGGDIRVFSSLERGTEFLITLPRRDSIGG